MTFPIDQEIKALIKKYGIQVFIERSTHAIEQSCKLDKLLDDLDFETRTTNCLRNIDEAPQTVQDLINIYTSLDSSAPDFIFRISRGPGFGRKSLRDFVQTLEKYLGKEKFDLIFSRVGSLARERTGALYWE